MNFKEGFIMLVLSRKLGERVIIGTGENAVVVTVVDIDRGKIRLGIEAPKNVPIMREELLTKPHGENNGHAPNGNG